MVGVAYHKLARDIWKDQIISVIIEVVRYKTDMKLKKISLKNYYFDRWVPT